MDDTGVVRLVGVFQVIAGIPSVVGRIEGDTPGFDDWPLREGDRITVERRVQRKLT